MQISGSHAALLVGMVVVTEAMRLLQLARTFLVAGIGQSVLEKRPAEVHDLIIEIANNLCFRKNITSQYPAPAAIQKSKLVFAKFAAG